MQTITPSYNGFQFNPVYSPFPNNLPDSAPGNLTGQPRVSQNPNAKEPPKAQAVTSNNNSSTPNDPNKSTEEPNKSSAATKTVSGHELTQSEINIINKLKQTDAEVRRHEMAHVAAGGRYITSGANFTYKRGPDGKNYAVGGEVGIDTSPIPGDPEATIQKMRQIKSAALAPANPSSQDLRVASKATSTSSKALSELLTLQAKERAAANDNKTSSNPKDAADSYEKINNLPEGNTHTFKIAV